MPFRLKRAVLILPICLTAFAAAPPLANSDPDYRRLRDGDPTESFTVENIVLKRDAGTLTLRKGAVSFIPAVLGRVAIGVFTGEGEFTLNPAAAGDRGYLNVLTGKEAVAEAFSDALLCFTDDTYQEIRRDARANAAEGRARDTLLRFRRRLRTRTDEPRSTVESLLSDDALENVEAEILMDLLNPKRAGLFSAYIDGKKYGDLRFHLRPRGAFADLPAAEQVALVHLDPQASDEGIWYLGSASGLPKTEQQAIAVDSYRIHTALAKNQHLSGKTTLRFRALSPGDRVLKLNLLPNLRVSRVALSDGKDVPFIQEDRKQDAAFYVVLPKPVAECGTEITVEYEGDKVIHSAGGGNFSVGARTSWYPNTGSFRARSKYELEFRCPKQYTLVSVGNLVKEWKEGDSNFSQWTSELPIPVAGFNYGEFIRKQVRDEPTQVAIEGYATKEMPDYLRSDELTGGMPKLLEGALADTQNSLRVYSHYFGPAPFKRVAITQQPEFNFGQSWPGLVYLPMSAFLDATQRWQLMGIQDRLTAFVDEVTPHEVAHQWWGHAVGWETFHDQWLSEGFAVFSAGLLLHATDPKPDRYRRYWDRARDTILEKNEHGLRANDAGPISMGLRLSTFKNPGAYSRLVYSKGGYVLHMLQRMMYRRDTKDAQFIKMMHEFVESHANRSASTASFQAIVEKYMTPMMDLDRNGKMDWFFSEWVHGSDIPRYKMDYTVTAQGDKWLLQGSVTQSGVSDRFKMVVPLYVELNGQTIMLGQVGMAGNSTYSDIKLLLPVKPSRVLVNANHDVLEMK